MSLDNEIFNGIFNNIREDEIIDYIQRLVRASSVNPPGDYGEITPVVVEMMKSIGFEVELKGHRPGKENIIGTLKGSEGKPNVLFVTHIDTVPIGDLDSWTVEPFGGLVKDGRIWGRGACDQKGLAAAVLMAAKALRDSYTHLKGDLILCCAVDEETGYVDDLGQSSGVKYLEESGFFKTIDMVVTPASFNWAIPLVGRGTVWVELTTYGEQGHPTGTAGKKPLNAISKMAYVLSRLQDIDKWMTYTPNELLGTKSGMWTDRPTLEPDVIQGGFKVNVVPDSCKVRLDMRILPGQTAKSVVEELEVYLKSLKREDPELRFDVKPILLDDPGSVEGDDNPAINAAVKAHQILFGRKPKFIGKTTPVGYYKDVRDSVIFGPKRGVAHMPDEWVSIKEIVNISKAYALIIMEILGAE